MGLLLDRSLAKIILFKSKAISWTERSNQTFYLLAEPKQKVTWFIGRLPPVCTIRINNNNKRLEIVNTLFFTQPIKLRLDGFAMTNKRSVVERLSKKSRDGWKNLLQVDYYRSTLEMR